MESSFVAPLLLQLIGSVERIAAGRSEALQALLDRVDVVVTDDPGLAFAVVGDQDPRELLVPVLGLEFLWAISFAHVTIYQHAKASAEEEMVFAVHPSTFAAAKVLSFAMSDRLDSHPTQAWPSNLPTPKFYPVGESREPSEVELATEIFACALAWILHHELGHIALDHLDKWSQEAGDEAAADGAATEWLLNDVTDPVVIMKCGLGMATAAVALFSFTCATRQPTDPSLYPSDGDRLLSALSHKAFGEDHQVHDYACVSLKVHLDHHRIEASPGPFDRAIDCLRSYAATATKHERALIAD